MYVLKIVILAFHLSSLQRCGGFKLRWYNSRNFIPKLQLGESEIASDQLKPAAEDITYKDLLKLSVSGFKTGAWFPIGPPSTLDSTLPFSIEVAGEKLVVWNNPLEMNSPTQGWSVMRDVCPHRLAPLSQGRVDPRSGCIECPYHGWQFDMTGQCTKVPQLEPELQFKLASPKAAADALPVYLTAGLLWAFVPLPSGPASYYPELPDDQTSSLNYPPGASLVRELPYSFDFLVENFFDVAHIPFAHHTLQSVRSDGKPMQVVDKSSDQACNVEFVDQVRGKRREGIMTFRPPGSYTLTVEQQIILYIFCMPVAPGRSRVILNVYPKSKNGSKIFALLPKWLLHLSSNIFLDSDLWVHDQELAARGVDPNKRFVQPPISKQVTASPTFSSPDIRIEKEDVLSEGSSPSNGIRIRSLEPYQPKYVILSKTGDVGVTSWRNWWRKRGMANSTVFGAAKALTPLSPQQQSNRYEGHVKYCVACQGALKNAELIQRWGVLLAILPIAFTQSIWLRLLGITSYALSQVIVSKVIQNLIGGVRGAKLTAAQFARVDKEPR